MSNVENNYIQQTKRVKRPKLAKYRPQLTKPEIDIIINCLSATLVSGYNNPGLPAVIKKFKLLAHKIDMDAISASYEVALPAKRSGFEPNAVNSLANPDAMQPAEQEGVLAQEEEVNKEVSQAINSDSLNPARFSDVQAMQEEETQLTETYVWEKYKALGGTPEALAQLSEEEQVMVSMYKANERLELSKDDEKRISEYMIKMLAGE